MQKQCKYLDKTCKSYNAKPSDRIYFGRYPYKVTLSLTEDLELYVKTMMTGYSPPSGFVERLEENPDSFDFNMAMHLVRMKENQAWKYLQHKKEQVSSLEKEPFQGERFYVDVYKHRLSCYLPNLDYTKTVINAFDKRVSEVRGPWNKKHVDMLINPNESVAVREKPYWNKYKIKVSAMPSYNFAWDKRREVVYELRDFFKTNTDPENTRFQRHKYGEVCFWTNEKDLKGIQPFLELAYPETRLHVTRCFTYK